MLVVVSNAKTWVAPKIFLLLRSDKKSLMLYSNSVLHSRHLNWIFSFSNGGRIIEKTLGGVRRKIHKSSANVESFEETRRGRKTRGEVIYAGVRSHWRDDGLRVIWESTDDADNALKDEGNRCEDWWASSFTEEMSLDERLFDISLRLHVVCWPWESFRLILNMMTSIEKSFV